MATFAVSFDLKYDENYSKRYHSVISYLRSQGVTWSETTSLVLVKSAKSVQEFETGLYYGSLIEAGRDKVLVIEVSYDNAVARGNLADTDTLRSLLYGITIL